MYDGILPCIYAISHILMRIHKKKQKKKKKRKKKSKKRADRSFAFRPARPLSSFPFSSWPRPARLLLPSSLSYPHAWPPVPLPHRARRHLSRRSPAPHRPHAFAPFAPRPEPLLPGPERTTLLLAPRPLTHLVPRHPFSGPSHPHLPASPYPPSRTGAYPFHPSLSLPEIQTPRSEISAREPRAVPI